MQVFMLTGRGAPCTAAAMTFAQWLEQQGLDDVAAGRLFARDRAHISKLRRRKARPSYELMLLIARVSKGAVGLDTWI